MASGGGRPERQAPPEIVGVDKRKIVYSMSVTVNGYIEIYLKLV